MVNHVLPQTKAEDSLKKRYLYKLFTNLIGFFLSLATAGIIPRGLGLVAYGNFEFLSNFFSQVIAFCDGGTYMALYTKISQRPHETGLIRFYWGFAALVSMAVLLLAAAAFALRLDNWLWPDQIARYIWLATIWGLLMWYSQVINHLVDAYGLTVKTEIVRIQQRVLGVSLVLLMLWLNRFSLAEFFLYHYFIILFLCLGWWRIMHQAGLALFPKVKLTFLEVKRYSREFYQYSAPLITYALIGLFVGLLDRWLLQRFSGSAEQGFYGLSYKIGTICFLFTGAMAPLLVREFAQAYGRQDLAQMRLLFQRYIPLLYVVAAFFSVFIALQADKVSLILGGSQFRGASLAVGIMAFYPIHQTYGQLSGSVLFATGQTKLYRNLGFITALINLPLTIWLLGPKEWSCLNLGAFGLAIEMVILQFIGVNLQLWFNARFLHLSFWRFLGHQVYAVALLIGIGWLVTVGVDWFIKSTVPAFLVAGFIYTIGVGLVLFLLPSLLFMSRAELLRQFDQLKSRLWPAEVNGPEVL